MKVLTLLLLSVVFYWSKMELNKQKKHVRLKKVNG